MKLQHLKESKRKASQMLQSTEQIEDRLTERSSLLPA